MDIDKIYAALQNAETGSQENPFIRTVAKKTPGGSTAFGPVQITGNLAENANNAGYLSNDSKKFYESVLKPKYELMKKNGNNQGKTKDYNPRYDYGGDAEFDPSQHAQAYEQFAKEVIQGVGNEAKGDENSFIQKWRGKSPQQDPDYYKRYEDGKRTFEMSHDIIKELQ